MFMCWLKVSDSTLLTRKPYDKDQEISAHEQNWKKQEFNKKKSF